MKFFLNCVFLLIVLVFTTNVASEMKIFEHNEEPEKEGHLLPKMEFEEILHDFGQITQEQGAKHKFVFRNSGNSDLVIVDLKSSCGCTAAIASTGPYKPGESGFVEVSYDSRAKVGFVHKDVRVYSNDPNSPISVTLQGIVLTAHHPTKGPGDILFQGSCAECHSMPAQGKRGEELYNAACALCHDFLQTVGSEPLALNRDAMSAISRRRLKTVIKEGVLNSSMPGFGKKWGGPLDKEQINSLVEYLISIKNKKEGG